MVRPSLPLALFGVGLLFASGCVPASAGMWLFQRAAAPDAACTTTTTDTYVADVTFSGEIPDDDPWTETTLLVESGAAFYGDLVALDDGSWALNTLDRVLVGTEGEDGTLTLTWTDSTTTDDLSLHDSGYRLNTTSTQTQILTVTLLRDGNSLATGSWSETVIEEVAWRESDTWDAATVGLDASQVPSGTYLADAALNPVTNDPTAIDCAENECRLAVTSTCTAYTTLSATRVLDNGDGDNGISGAASGS